MARHILGALGVIAALVLLLVSMMMNYKFGASLGKTATDQQIYGMASAAADCFKALAPFFFFAALRNRVWSQAVAAAMVWGVVTVYAFTSALGHAALNRFDTSGQRVAASTSYKDTRAELQRAEDQLKWIPPTRPPSTVDAEINVLKAQRSWMTSKECTEATLKVSREFCQQYFKLSAEHASGVESEKLRVKIAELSAQAGKATGAAVLGLPDPQANVISRMTGFDLETVQTGLMLFVALLIEIGSGFGMYVAFAYWRPNHNLHDIGQSQPESKTTKVQPARREDKAERAEKVEKVEKVEKAERAEDAPTGKADPIWTAEPAAATDAAAEAKDGTTPPAVRPFGDNDNKNAPRWIMPENDVELFYKQAVKLAEGDTVVSQELYDGYKLWAKSKDKRPLNHSRFSEDFEKLGYKTVQIGGRQRYVGIMLTPELNAEVEKKASFRKRKTALTQGPSGQQAKSADDQVAAAAGQLQATADEMRAGIDQREAAPGEAKAA